MTDLGNAPAVAIAPYLLKTEQTSLSPVISIDAKEAIGSQVRLPYMNALALAL